MTRVRSGAPNEARYGFSQAVARGGAIAVAGQVGKDNRTGVMVDERDLERQAARALGNVRDAAAEAGGAAVVALTAYVAGPVRDALGVLERELRAWPPPALTVARVPALSHATYRLETSAIASGRSTTVRIEATDGSTVPWAPAAVVSGSDVHVSACHGHGAAPGAALAEALDAVARVLVRAGCTPADVLREDVYVVGPVDAAGFDDICRVHAAAYGDAAPASTLVLVDELPGGARAAVAVSARRACLTSTLHRNVQ